MLSAVAFSRPSPLVRGYWCVDVLVLEIVCLWYATFLFFRLGTLPVRWRKL